MTKIGTLFRKWKILSISFLGIALIFTPLFSVQAAENHSGERISLEAALHKISQRYDVYFNYDRNIMKGVMVDYEENEELSLVETLDHVFETTEFGYRIFEQRYVVVFQNDNQGTESLKNMITHMQDLVEERESENKRIVLPVDRLATLSAKDLYHKRLIFKVSGTVTDEGGEPLIGVNIQVKGSNKGTSTDFDGNFTLDDIAENAVLIVSYVGYQTQEVPTAGKSNLDIVMISDSQLLDEVVVVGYGTQKKSDLTGAVKTIGEKEIQDMPVSAIDQKLIGRIAGVEIRQVSGAPGAGSSVKIRGSGSLGAGNEPLYVIDGMPYSSGLNQDVNPLTFLDPNDIQDITILKDASSTAIYGSRGANGVIMITTKGASTGQARISYSGYAGVSSVPQKGRPDMMNAREFAEFQRDRIDYAIRQREEREPRVEDYPIEYQNLDRLGEGTNWYDLLLRDAFIQKHNLSIQKGADNSQLYMSLGYYDQGGTIKYTGMKRYSMNINYNHKLSEKIELGVNLMPSFIKQDRASTGTGRDLDPTGISLWANPATSPYDNDGNLLPYITTPSSKYNSTWDFPNPLFMLLEAPRKYNEIRNLGSANIRIYPIKNLEINSSYNTIFSGYENTLYNPTTIGRPNNPPANIKGSLNYGSGNNFDWVFTNTVTYQNTFTKHSVTGMVGYITQKSSSNSKNINAGPYSSDLIKTLNVAEGVTSWGEGINEWSMISYLSRINYGYSDRYLLTLTMRSDGSSRFGAENRYALFPSMALAWRVSEENFLKNVDWIDQLKIRASYGKSGNNNIGNYSHLSNVSIGRYTFNDNTVSAAAVSLSNPELGWEESNQADLGIDLSILNGKFGFGLDFYRRVSNNMLLNNVIPAITGFNNQLVNLGSVLNRGVEIEFDGRPNIGHKLNWNFNFNIAFNRNRVLSTNEEGDDILAGSMDGRATNISIVGKPIGEFYGFILDGVYSQADIDNPDIPKYPGATAGYPKYRDLNGDGAITEILDYTNLGSPHPDFTFGFTNQLDYGNFDFSLSLNGRYGGYVMDGMRQTIDNVQGFFNLSKEWVNRWRSDEIPGDGLHALGPNGVHRVNDKLWLEDASYLRISNISLGYLLGSGNLIGQKSFFKNVRIVFSAQNLATFTKYTGQNPEGQGKNVNNTLATGYDVNSYPIPRSMTLGLNIGL